MPGKHGLADGTLCNAEGIWRSSINKQGLAPCFLFPASTPECQSPDAIPWLLGS